MRRAEGLALVGILLLAAALRLPGLADRGPFDADQGHDMQTLAAFTRDGDLPLLGPKTSVGEFHHGAFYYFLLAPAAAISDDDPVAVMAWLALLGLGAVALTWWLARSMAGPLAGVLAALILALSPAGIDESTFIWNPNPIPFFAALALAAAWRARSTGRARWWALAVGAAGAVVQLHVLGLVFFLAILALNLLQARRTRAAWLGMVGGLVLVAVLFAPLAVHELSTGFLETHRVLDYLASGDAQATSPVPALALTLLRIVGWPIVGLVTDAPTAAALLLALLLGLVAFRALAARGPERIALAWLIGLLAWSTIVLAFAAPSLQTVVAGLPNDHYHASLDPVIATLLGMSIAPLLARAVQAWREGWSLATLAPAIGGVAALLLVVGLEIARIPPPDPDGGWAAAQAAGVRVVARLQGSPASIVSLPDFKLADGITFPIDEAVRRLPSPSAVPSDAVVVVCDRLFESQIGAPCGGPAEDAFMASAEGPGTPVTVVDRFDASPRTAISIYAPGSP